MINNMSYYEILEVRDDASPEVIKMAYKALCLKYHPDTTKIDLSESHKRIQQIIAAYEVLSNKEKRLEYDRKIGLSNRQYSNSWSSTKYHDAARKEERRKQEEAAAAREEARKRQEAAARAEAKKRQEAAAREEARRKEEAAAEAEKQRQYEEIKRQEAEKEAERLRRAQAYVQYRRLFIRRVKDQAFAIYQLFLFAIFVLIIGFSGTITTAVTYENAQELLEKGEFLKAASQFESLKDYKDSEKYFLECNYQIGQFYMEEGQFDSAVSWFKDVGYKNSRIYLYQIATAYQSQKEYGLASKTFEKVGVFKDSISRAVATKYLYALDLFNSANSKRYYLQALTIFEELDGYKDSERYAKLCKTKL